MNTIDIVRTLGLSIGTQHELTGKDWTFKFPYGKSKAALVGLAIDQHIKSLLAPKGITVPADQYAPYDFLHDGIHFDIKSFSRSSVSISENEYKFAEELRAQGKMLIYIVFEQLDDQYFVFRGFVKYDQLADRNKIFESQYKGYYFTLNDSVVKRELFE